MEKHEIRDICDIVELNEKLGQKNIKFLGIEEFDLNLHISKIDNEIEKLLQKKKEAKKRIEERSKLLNLLDEDFFDIKYIFTSDLNLNAGISTIMSKENLLKIMNNEDIHFISIKSFKNVNNIENLDFLPKFQLDRMNNPHKWIIHLLNS